MRLPAQESWWIPSSSLCLETVVASASVQETPALRQAEACVQGRQWIVWHHHQQVSWEVLSLARLQKGDGLLG